MTCYRQSIVTREMPSNMTSTSRHMERATAAALRKKNWRLVFKVQTCHAKGLCAGCFQKHNRDADLKGVMPLCMFTRGKA